jgi:hypothetical protein
VLVSSVVAFGLKSFCASRLRVLEGELVSDALDDWVALLWLLFIRVFSLKMCIVIAAP